MDDIIECIIGSVVIAFVLNVFGLSNFLIQIIQPQVTIKLTTSTYYCIFAVIGAIVGCIEFIRKRK